MAIKKQVIVLSVLYNEDEISNGNAKGSIEHEMYNIDGIIEWDSKIVSEESLSADLTEEDLKKI